VGNKPLFSKVLVANRGEIAIRVFRTCHELGIDTVAVYSEADRTAPHVATARQALPIGPAPASESYLRFENVLEAAARSGAEALHPGYGFLAENADFAEAVLAAGLVWIGPPPAAMRMLGDKTAARAMASRQGVPVIPGTPSAVRSAKEAASAAAEIGYPVLLKAAAGGGGKGMRVVHEAAELKSSLKMARSEARSAFGDDGVFLEKYLERPRHVEIQFMADQHGNCVWLGERECSVQRRHQKIIEETPSLAVTADMRAEMGDAAVRLALAAGYVNAGTAEFLLDGGSFYFLEVNTRLQVEHPVTELVTRRDLVRDQLLVASGRELDYAQDDVRPEGAAIEVRIYAEDPDNNFFPAPGRITFMDPPAGPGIRHDCGVAPGSEVTLHYDPLIAKLVAWAPDRAGAIGRIYRALEEYQIAGVTTILPFLREILHYEPFLSGKYDTHIVPRMMEERTRRIAAKAESGPPGKEEQYAFVAAVAAALFHTLRPAGFVGESNAGEQGGLPRSQWARQGRELREWER
jgi:acetyl-CoA carboxylase biotin carboxylase subunit